MWAGFSPCLLSLCVPALALASLRYCANSCTKFCQAYSPLHIFTPLSSPCPSSGQFTCTIKPICFTSSRKPSQITPDVSLLQGLDQLSLATVRLSNRNHRTSLANIKTHLFLASLGSSADLGWSHSHVWGFHGCWRTQADLDWDDKSI